MPTYFSDFFGVKPEVLGAYGAVNISLITDIPLFIDPFLLFNSTKPEYKKLHEEMIGYLRFLYTKSEEGDVDEGQLQAWYHFKEIKQTWLGFSKTSNQGHGLGHVFAVSLNKNLNKIFQNIERKNGTRTNHLEKVGLVKDGVGRDNISDFTTNLIKHYLCDFTEKFAKKYVAAKLRKRTPVVKAKFNYDTETWETRSYELPYINGDYVILVPKDMLTRDDYWINSRDLFDQFRDIPEAVSDLQLRSQINTYFEKKLYTRPNHTPTKDERDAAIQATLDEYPVLLDAFIKIKEAKGEEATERSQEKVAEALKIFIEQVPPLQEMLSSHTGFYKISGNTYKEAHQRAAYLKDIIENKGGHRLFYVDGKAIHREADLQILYRLVWIGTPSDVSREVNDGRGPADFKVSRGAKDKTIVEMKLASNSQLEKNLKSQAEVYQRASDAKEAIKIIIYFSLKEKLKVERILKKLGLDGHKDIVLIDGGRETKLSASKV